MKKIIYCVLASVALIACTKELKQESVQIQSLPDGKYIITISASASELTKTSYAGETDFSWDAHDKISVLFHNGETHEFYDLETEEGAAHGESAVFKGVIDAGFEIGASDAEGGVKWALYPAGAHTWDKTNHRPVFNIPNVTDFTTADHISSNIPLFAQGSGDSYTFRPLAGAYKITFNNIDASKVRLVVTHNQTHQLSGNFPISSASSVDSYWWAQYASAGSANQSITIVKNVETKTASFYFFCGVKDEEGFQPTITLKNESTGYILYNGTAKSAWSSDALMPKNNRIVILPSIPASGTGVPFISKFGIDWASVSASGTGTSTDALNGITTLKATADASYVYILLGVDKTSLLLDTGTYANLLNVYLGSESSANVSWMWGTAPNTFDADYTAVWLTQSGLPKCTGTGNLDAVDNKTEEVNGVYFYELRISRTDSHITALPAGKGHVGLRISHHYYDWTGSGGDYMYAPAGGSLLEIDLP